MTDHHKDQLLKVLTYHMTQDVRAIAMREAPAAYNAYFGREIVKVVRAEDGSEIGR
jgi:hypothetical protein